MKPTKAFVEEIRGLIRSARATVSRGVDWIQVCMNFEIGRRIVEQEQQGKGRAAYGKEVIKALADRLTDEFGKGFSLSNLKLMRQFYLQFPDWAERIGQTVSGQLRKPGRQASPPRSPQSTELALLPDWTEKAGIK